MRWMWIDRIVALDEGRQLVAIKNVSLAEEHLHDHFEADPARSLPALPVAPTSLVIEGMAQTAGVLVGHARGFREKVILAKIRRAEMSRDAGPGMTLRYTATVESIGDAGASTTGLVELFDHAYPDAGWAEVGRIDLIFSHVDNNLAGTMFPKENFVFSEAFKTLLEISGIEASF